MTQAVGQFPFSGGLDDGTIAAMTASQAQAFSPAQETGPRLGERLLAKRVITEAQLRHALQIQPQSARPLGRVLVELGVLDEDRLTAVLGEHLDVPVANLRRNEADAEAARHLPEAFARRHVVLPRSRQNGALGVPTAAPATRPLIH